MSESTTRNPIDEQARRLAAEILKSAHSTDDWRTAQAEHMGYTRAFIDTQSAINARLQQDIADLHAKIDAKVNAVSSSVSNERLESRFTLREMVVGWLTLVGSIGALIAFIGWYLGRQP